MFQWLRQWFKTKIRRPVLAFFRMPGSRGFGILLLVFTGIVTVAVLDLHWTYINPETGDTLDLFAAIYSVFALLVFETPLPLPHSWITRLVFFAVPISGILVLGQGLVRLGSALMDRDKWSKAMASTYTDHTIVCGLGKVSTRVVQWLLDLEEEVVVIEQNGTNPFVAEVRQWDVPVIIGDARRPEILTDAGINAAESIVPCTNDDLINLGIALEARRLVPDIKVVLRMFDVQMAANVRAGFNIHTAFSIPELSAPAFAAAATKTPIDYAFSFGEGNERSLITITKFTVVDESPLVGYTIGQVEDEFNVSVIALRQDGEFMFHPPDDAVLVPGDRFVVSAPMKAIMKIAGLTPPTRDLDRYLQGQWPLAAAASH
jgi:Trk K+ transport system NAD-binding subunit